MSGRILLSGMGGNNARQSNYELLRLVCMLMVVNLHSFWGYDHGDGIGQAIDFFRETACISAVDTFILISGFWGIKWRFKSLFNLLFQVAFYSFVIYGLCVCVGWTDFSMKDFGGCFKCFYKSWGFISAYIVLYFLSPALNAVSERSTPKTLVLFILVLLLANIFIMGLNVIVTYSTVYLLGRLLKKTDSINSLKTNAGLLYLAVTFIIFVIVYALYLLFGFGAVRMQSLFVGYNYSAPLVIIQGVALFLVFGRIKIHTRFNRFINWCSSSCLAIYLIHMHPSVKLFYFNYTESLYNKPVFEHIGCLCLLFIVVFILSIFIDKIRILISNIVLYCLTTAWNSLPHKIKSLTTYCPRVIKRVL